MLVLRPYDYKLLPVVPRGEWLVPSQAQPKDDLGNDGITRRYKLTARTHDGVVRWRGWFDDREDADAFLWALATGYVPRELRRLPTPEWSEAYEGLAYDFATQVTITTTSSSNQTYTTPSDWVASNNLCEVLGGGGGGSNSVFGTAGDGGGGGAYSGQSNVNIAPSTGVSFRLEASAAQLVAGNDTWFNGSTLAGSSVGAKGGDRGNVTFGAGGQASSGVGAVKYSGGNGIAHSGGTYGGAGGSAAGPNGNALASSATTSGAADNGFGGGAASADQTGNAGAEWGTVGSGSGGGGRSVNGVGRTGGLYGGAGGGGLGGNNNGGGGRQGIIVLSYTPLAYAFPFKSSRMHPVLRLY